VFQKKKKPSSIDGISDIFSPTLHQALVRRRLADVGISLWPENK
jgi:hypothetical protein